MAIVNVYPKDNEQADNLTASAGFIVVGGDSISEVIAFFQSEDAIPYLPVFGALGIGNITVNIIPSLRIGGEKVYDAVVRFDGGSNQAVPEPSFEFDTTGGTQHITQSLETIASMAASGTPPNYNGAINVSADGASGSVEGTDIVIPKFSWGETHYISVDESYKLLVEGLTGTVNNGSFKGRAAGEVLFLGASGSKRSRFGDWEVKFFFASSRNVTGKSIPGLSGTYSKAGWDYLWIRYGTGTDQNTFIKKPIGAYIERVYERADFSVLGIGT